jgi:hypothetical protein
MPLQDDRLARARQYLTHDEPGAVRGGLLPLLRGADGSLSPAVPQMIREAGVGLLDLLAGTRTGDLTPEATAALFDVAGGGAASAGLRGAGSLGIFGGMLAKTADKGALAKAQEMAALERGGKGGVKSAAMAKRYPMAPRERWYGDANYQQTGGQIVEMTPDEFLAKARPMEIDDVARENIDDLKRHIQGGGELDPLAIYKNGKEDGRHRAHAAKELGMKTVPVLTWTAKGKTPSDPFDSGTLAARVGTGLGPVGLLDAMQDDPRKRKQDRLN